MGNGLLIRTAQIKTRQWSSFLLSFPSFSLHFPPSSACLPVCPACVISPPPTSSAPLSLSLLSFTPTKEKKVFACIRESKSLWGFPCPSLLSLLSCFPPLISPQMRNLPLLSWKRNILAISNLKDAQKLTNIQSHQAEIYSVYNVRLFTVLSAALWHPFTWDLLSISHTSDSVLCHN